MLCQPPDEYTIALHQALGGLVVACHRPAGKEEQASQSLVLNGFIDVGLSIENRIQGAERDP